jgi:hypothetical protein
MSEGANIEVAHSLSEAPHEHHAPHSRWHRVLEVVEIIVLAVVAVATAWSGYQAARWDGRQTVLYGQANRDRFAADAASTHGGQELVANVGLFTAWLQAHSAGDVQLQQVLERRMTTDYRIAFNAWLATDPFTNELAPPGPYAMPEYKNPDVAAAAQLNAQASATFDEGTKARETGEKYIRNTVIFAVVLFIVAIAQRIQDRFLRLATNGIGIVLLAFALVSSATLDRI